MRNSRIRERYKRLIKLSFAVIMLLGLCLLYAVVWSGYYNETILQAPFYRRGNWMMVLIYGILLAFFMSTYGGFEIGYLKNGNLIYSQVISVLFTNIVTYLQIAVIDRRLVNPIYLLPMTLAEIAFIIIWTMLFQTVYRNMFPPRKMLFVEGDRKDYHLRDKMNARDDKYQICEVISYKSRMEDIKKKIDQYDAVVLGDMPSHERNLLLKYCYMSEIRTYSVPKISDVLLRSSDELNIFDTPLMLSRNIGLSIEQEWIKRAEDVLIASLMFVLFSPIFLIAAIGIKCTDNGPVFYKQERLTKNGKKFMIYKFRTMIVDAEKTSGPVLATDKDPRVLPIGKVLRATRLDELPQIVNILKGEMSVVGPRPERPDIAAEIEKDVPEFSYRLKVKSGLTGYAQVYGKYNTTFYDKLKLDLMYIRKYSLLLDLKLILMTPKIMFLKESTEGVVEGKNSIL
ncbi:MULTISPECIES: exopolysaccharide biosynthesis polyprenyl glycosylphosphotransferase [Bacteria]|mgnify:FL=1|jgi:exopolysaccharide biosynthesis polyprenyl glycosylphosphotransferase|uniref:exopolysaccharide biosynthesis polyprenyl glycosylphosphotransferase n=1 Tax=Bacteria TaxID=2 RepID=UPI00082D5047|nr:MULTISPECIES: exopolysaccharide biosynthesis polyprenyl glycosylphosphotransferase [Bacteria]